MAPTIRPVFLFCLALLTSVPLVASAQTRSIRVHSFDLDLSSGAGQAKLEQRIQRAVDQVCGSSTGANLDSVTASLACKKTAQATAMSQFEAMVKTAREGKMAGAQTQDVIVR